jgi:hypothetical protein
LQLILYQRQFARQPCGMPRRRKVGVRPAMVADLKSHPVQFGDVIPVHEMFAVRHPVVRHEESRPKTKFLQQGGCERTMRFDGVVHCQDNRAIGDSRANQWRRQRSGRECPAAEQRPTPGAAIPI